MALGYQHGLWWLPRPSVAPLMVTGGTDTTPDLGHYRSVDSAMALGSDLDSDVSMAPGGNTGYPDVSKGPDGSTGYLD